MTYNETVRIGSQKCENQKLSCKDFLNNDNDEILLYDEIK